MTDTEKAAAKAKLRKNLIRTLVEQGAEQAYAELYVDARVHIEELLKSGDVVVSIGTPGASSYRVATDNRVALRAFGRAMRYADPTAALGTASLVGETRQERVAILRENLIGALIERGADSGEAARTVDAQVTLGVLSSHGPAIAAIGEAHFTDDPRELSLLAGRLIATHPQIVPHRPAQDDDEQPAIAAAEYRHDISHAF